MKAAPTQPINESVIDPQTNDADQWYQALAKRSIKGWKVLLL
jgi:hypothetical protein